MPQIKKFFECLLPVSACNLKCEYCYVIQREQNKKEIPELDYSPEIIGKALTVERLGGVCFFSICGLGETFIPDYLIDIVYQLLNNGHYVNVTTNGTLSKKIRQLERIPSELLSRLQIAFSFHYLELKRLNLIDAFFENVNFVKKLGCSFLVQLNLYDNYIPHLEDIINICNERVGAPPQLVATRKEESLTKKIELMTQLSQNEYFKLGDKFQSPLFNFTMSNFNVPQKKFCYAGDWSYTLNLKTGVLKRCYASTIHQNIFKDIKKPIYSMAVGNCCSSLYCLNSSWFLSLGTIPELETPSYVELRDRAEVGWYNEDMKEFLSGKLENNNQVYSKGKKFKSNIVGVVDKLLYHGYRKAKNLKRK